MIMAVPVYCWHAQRPDLALYRQDALGHALRVAAAQQPRRAGHRLRGREWHWLGVLALQALYRYFYNWAFHGLDPLPVTRFNFDDALAQAEKSGAHLVQTLRAGIRPFTSLGDAMLHYEQLPYMNYQPLDAVAPDRRAAVSRALAGGP